MSVLLRHDLDGRRARWPLARQAPPRFDWPARAPDRTAERCGTVRAQKPGDAVTLAEIRRKQAAAQFGTKVSPTLSTGTDPLGMEQRNLGLGITRRLRSGADLQVSATSFQYGTGAGAIRDAGYSIGLSQPLLRGFGQTAHAELDTARRGVDSAERSRVDARQQLVIAVAEAFLGAVRARRLVEAGEHALEHAGKFREASAARAAVGLATELDVLRADLFRSQARATLSQSREALESSLDDLKTLIGRPLDVSLELEDLDLSDGSIAAAGLAPDAGSPGESGDAVVGRLIQSALSSRPDVQEAREQIGDARRAERVARWNLLPPVTLDVNYTRRGLGTPSSDVFSQLLSGWRFGLSTSYALDHADEQAAAASAAVSAAAAARASADTDRRVAAEVRRAYRLWQRTAESVEIQSTAVQLADKQLRVAEIRYERGLGSSFDIVDAENGLYLAQSALIGARVERTLAGLSLRRASGRLNVDELSR